jgi:hypothetical protein
MDVVAVVGFEKEGEEVVEEWEMKEEDAEEDADDGEEEEEEARESISDDNFLTSRPRHVAINS